MSYTLGIKSKFLDKLRRLLTVNPDANSGIPLTGTYRLPSPGSQPPTYKHAKTKHSDVAQNYYYTRDTRRNYPQTEFYTQNDIAGLIAATNLKSIASGKEGESTQIANLPEKLSITEIIASSPEAFYSENKLPPVPGKSRHDWKQSPEQEKADPDVYWPMRLVS